jgi:hypothetical protein
MSEFNKVWKQYLEEMELDEKTRAGKEGVTLDTNFQKLEKLAEGSDDMRPTAFLHFSDINKLGINPQSHYNTPLGIYAYPNTAYIRNLFRRGKLPFAQDRKYIVTFKVKPDQNIIYNDGKKGIPTEQYYNYLDEMATEEFFKKNQKAAGLYELRDEIKDIKHGSGINFINQLKEKSLKKLKEKGRNFEPTEGEENDQGLSLNLVDMVVRDFVTYPFGEVRTLDEMETELRLEQSFWNDEEIERKITDEDVKIILSVCEPYLDIIEAGAAKLRQATDKDIERANKFSKHGNVALLTKYSEFLAEKEGDATFKHNLGMLWNVTRNVAQSEGKAQSMIAWRKILVTLGIDGIVDAAGEGLIHPSEKVQAVFFSKKAVELQEVIPNTETPDAITRRGEAERTLKAQRRTSELWKEVTGLPRIPRESGKLKLGLLTAMVMDILYKKLWDENERYDTWGTNFNHSFAEFYDQYLDGYGAKRVAADRMREEPNNKEYHKITLDTLNRAEEMARIEIMKAWFNYTFHEQKQQVQAVLRKAQEEGIITEPERLDLWYDFSTESGRLFGQGLDGNMPPDAVISQAKKMFDEVKKDVEELLKGNRKEKPQQPQPDIKDIFK